jgi:hypothetical protein
MNFWTAPAQRSDDGALEGINRQKAVSRFACHRSPNEH